VTAISALSDITGYVAQLMSLERQQGPISLYQQEQQDLTLRSATLTDLRTNLSAVNTAAQALAQVGALSPFQAKTVTSSLPTVATATATASALSGNHSLLVTQLARADTLTSKRFADADADLATAVGAGTKTVRIGVDGANYDIQVALGAGDSNKTVLTNLAAAINANAGASAKVTASVVQVDDTGSKLVLRSKQTGLSHALSLSDQVGTLFASGDLRDGAAADDGANRGGYLFADSTLDAKFTLDGLTLTRSSNTVTDALTGVTLTLLGTQATDATPVSLTAGADESGIKAKVQTFLDSYNTLIKYLAERTSTKVSLSASTTGSTSVNSIQRGTLDAEPAYLNLLIALRSDIGGRIGSAASGGPAALVEIGITTGSDGTLSITDSARFSTALKNPDGIAALFSSSDGISTRVQNRLTGFLSAGGVLDRSQDAVTSRQSSLTLAIQQQEDMLKVKQAGLTQQLTGLQEALAMLAQQQSVLDSITGATTILF
jgi:flagellar hook-associated protein 2